MTASAASGSTDIADCQIALNAMRHGVVLWSADGHLPVRNSAASAMMNISPGVEQPGVARLEVMAFLTQRGDCGPIDNSAALARKLCGGFCQGAVNSLTRHPSDGRSLVTYREASDPAEVNAGA